MKFGRFQISLVNFGYFRLDGGAMFGSVPKNIWSKRFQPDEENCLPLATRCLLLRDGNATVLVDVGMGEKWNEKSRQIFAIQNTPESDWGFTRDQVTHLVLTHLHFDHCGGVSRWEQNSKVAVHNFPKAEVILQQRNWEYSQAPSIKERASYLAENITVLKQGQLRLVQGSTEVYPDIWVHQVNGHTEGQQTVEIRSGKNSILYPTDLIPTSHHLPIPFHMGYDACATTLLKEKERFLTAAMESEAIVVFEHDPAVPAALIGKDERGHFCVRERVSL